MEFAPLKKNLKKLFNTDIYSENLFIKNSYLKSEIVVFRCTNISEALIQYFAFCH
jgi:hypothetical protein